jgi:hypothetical protein
VSAWSPVMITMVSSALPRFFNSANNSPSKWSLGRGKRGARARVGLSEGLRGKDRKHRTVDRRCSCRKRSSTDLPIEDALPECCSRIVVPSPILCYLLGRWAVGPGGGRFGATAPLDEWCALGTRARRCG